VSAYLQVQGIDHEWMDARGLIKTDNAFREARILWDKTHASIDALLKKSLEKNGMVVTQGFIGSTIYNESTSLGREGSDYTAAILAHALDAHAVTIWKDVPGIMTGDPKRFPAAEKLADLSYQEAIEMTYYGAKVIHPKTIKPLQNKPCLRLYGLLIVLRKGTKIGGPWSAFPPIVVIETNRVLLRFPLKIFHLLRRKFGRFYPSLTSASVNSIRSAAISLWWCSLAFLQNCEIDCLTKENTIIYENIELSPFAY
jgi:aspartate kinase